MSEEQRERDVFDQELSVDDLDAAAGGSVTYWYAKDKDENHCTEVHERQFYLAGGSIDCAATVEDGSWCIKNDACNTDAIVYQGMTDCRKAWK